MQEDYFGRYFCLLNGSAIPQFLNKGEGETDISSNIEFWKMFMKLKKKSNFYLHLPISDASSSLFLKKTPILEWLLINLIFFPNIKIMLPSI